MTVLLGFAAMTIDVGMMYSIRAELQRTADAAALAAVQDLREADPSTTELARRTVSEYVAHNPILNAQQALFDPHKSVVFGRALVNEAESRVDFTPGVTPPNAVRVPGCGSAAAHRRRYPRNAACAQLRTG
jgi:Flp pilus assembly protein TadG